MFGLVFGGLASRADARVAKRRRACLLRWQSRGGPLSHVEVLSGEGSRGWGLPPLSRRVARNRPLARTSRSVHQHARWARSGGEGDKGVIGSVRCSIARADNARANVGPAHRSRFGRRETPVLPTGEGRTISSGNHRGMGARFVVWVADVGQKHRGHTACVGCPTTRGWWVLAKHSLLLG